MFLLGLMFANVANALDCEKVPDCESLGYSKAEDPNCADNGYLNCPFDQDYKVCVQYNCEALGFTESDKTSWCADLIECKGNSQMTLCQKPCLATNAQELKELAESGKCKVVTMRNDIEMPINEKITLHANTIIDGGNHTLISSGNKGFDVYTLNNNTGFKNIFIKHNQEQMQTGLNVFRSTNGSKVTLHDTRILVQSNDEENHATPLFRDGTYEISGQFTADIQAKWHYSLSSATLIFKDADINITTTGQSSDGFNGNVDFINSRGTITTSGVSIIYDRTLTFENSKINLKAPEIFWTYQIKYGTILLKNNAEVKLMFSNLISGSSENVDKLAHIKFESSASAPATLIIEGNERLDSGDVKASNPADTLVLNGTTYHPVKEATVLVSEVATSDAWKEE